MGAKAFATTVLVVLAAVGAGEAAEPPALVPGARVRIWTGQGSSQRLIGGIHAIDDETLTLLTEDHALVKVRRDVIRTLELSYGLRRHVRRDALIGAAVGLGLELIRCADNLGPAAFGRGCTGDEKTEAGLTGAAFGAGYGALIGVVDRSERWAVVPAGRPAARVGRGPHGGWAATFTIPF